MPRFMIHSWNGRSSEKRRHGEGLGSVGSAAAEGSSLPSCSCVHSIARHTTVALPKMPLEAEWRASLGASLVPPLPLVGTVSISSTGRLARQSLKLASSSHGSLGILVHRSMLTWQSTLSPRSGNLSTTLCLPSPSSLRQKSPCFQFLLPETFPAF